MPSARFCSSSTAVPTTEGKDTVETKSEGSSGSSERNRLVLFDMEGTIGNMTKSQKFIPRPGIRELTVLKAEGYQVGLFTNKAARNLPRSVIEAFAGIKFDVVFTGEHCKAASEGYCRAEGISKHSMIKPLAKVGDLNNLLLVDDTPGKVVPQERHRVVAIKTWEHQLAKEDDGELKAVVQQILSNWGDRSSWDVSTTSSK